MKVWLVKDPGAAAHSPVHMSHFEVRDSEHCSALARVADLHCLLGLILYSKFQREMSH